MRTSIPSARDHRAVLDARADDQPVARVAEERGQPDEYEPRGGDLDEAVVRDRRAEDDVVSIIQRGNRERPRVEAPDRLDQGVEGEREPDRDEHLLDRPQVERPDQDELDQAASDGAGGDPEDAATISFVPNEPPPTWAPSTRPRRPRP